MAARLKRSWTDDRRVTEATATDELRNAPWRRLRKTTAKRSASSSSIAPRIMALTISVAIPTQPLADGGVNNGAQNSCAASKESERDEACRKKRSMANSSPGSSVAGLYGIAQVQVPLRS